jgi:hypothetical protein
MICLINAEKVKKFTNRANKRDSLITDVNLRSSEGADLAIYQITELFKHRNNGYRQHLRFWVTTRSDGSFKRKAQLIRECMIENNSVIFLDE